MFKAIIVGCGKVAGYFDRNMRTPAYTHAQAYAKTPGITVADYIDIELKKARRLAEKYKCSRYGSNLIASINQVKPNVVSICTPDMAHFTIAKMILNNKVVPQVIFIEKPVCSNMREFKELRELSQNKNTVIIVNHSRRFDNKYKNLKEMVQKRVFGSLVRLDAYYYGGFRHNGVHVIDTLIFLFNDRLILKEVSGRMRSRYQGDPTLDASFVFAKNKASVYLHAFNDDYYQIFDFDFKFERARLKIENFESRIIFEKKAVNSMKENVTIDAKLSLGNGKATPMENAIKTIVRYLKTRNPLLIKDYTIDSAENTMRVIQEAIE